MAEILCLPSTANEHSGQNAARKAAEAKIAKRIREDLRALDLEIDRACVRFARHKRHLDSAVAYLSKSGSSLSPAQRTRVEHLIKSRRYAMDCLSEKVCNVAPFEDAYLLTVEEGAELYALLSHNEQQALWAEYFDPRTQQGPGYRFWLFLSARHHEQTAA